MKTLRVEVMLTLQVDDQLTAELEQGLDTAFCQLELQLERGTGASDADILDIHNEETRVAVHRTREPEDP